MHVPEDISREILEIHELFQAWYQGVLPEGDLSSKIGVRLAEDFCMTFPDGSVHTKADLLAMMQADWGNDSKYRIVISDIVMLDAKDSLCWVTYTESQYWYGAEEANLVIHAVSSLRRSPEGWLWVSIYEERAAQ
jgi:hypothetical protein